MKRSRSMQLVVLMLMVTVLGACAPRPKLYPNSAFMARGRAGAEADVNRCMRDAESYLASGKGKQVARGAGYGAVVGGVVGAVSGLFSGDVGRGAAQGAAMGGVGGGTAGALSPDQIKRNYVNQCLAEKGYQVLGWD